MNSIMKKLIYSLALVLAGLTSCTSFDDPVTENYGAGPDIDIQLVAGQQTDSAFTVTITPAAGAAYYAYVIGESDEPEDVDAATLYKGGYGNTVLKAADNPTFTIDIDDADPNTTYQVYAVAGSDKGILGKLAVKSIKTSDNGIPDAKSLAKDADKKAVVITFTENIVRGDGAATAKYYKEWDILNPVEIPAEEITVEVAKNAVMFTAPKAPAGAYVCFSYEAGAFKDIKGNPCKALSSGLNMNTGKFTNAYVHVTTEAFELEDTYVTAPADGALIGKVADFKGEITFPFNIYRNDKAVEDGDLSVTFKSAKRTSTYKLTADEWSVDGKVLNFVLPATPDGGDFITVSLIEGAVADVLGNPNAAYTSKAKWQFFAPTKDMVLGTFNMSITYEGEALDLGKFSITENATEENPTGLKFKDWYLEGSELKGYYDLAAGKVYMEEGQFLGMYTNSKGATYALVFFNRDNDTDDAIPVPFTINADGTMDADAEWGLFAFDETGETPLGWFEIAETCKYTPAKAAAARKTAARAKVSKSVKSKLFKHSKSVRKQNKRVSK